jgi:hypothetical protein
MSPIRGPVLTRALDSKDSPVRRFVDSLLTSKDGLRALRTEFSGVAGSLLVDTEEALAGTIGTAFGIAIAMLIDPVPDFGLAASGAANLGPASFAGQRRNPEGSARPAHAETGDWLRTA